MAVMSSFSYPINWEAAYVAPRERPRQRNLLPKPTGKTVFERFSLDGFPDWFEEYADLLDWYQTWDVTLDTSNPPF